MNKISIRCCFLLVLAVAFVQACGKAAQVASEPGAELALSDPGIQRNREGDAVKLQLDLHSGGGSSVRYTAKGLPGGLSIDEASGEIKGLLDYSTAGEYTVGAAASSGSQSVTMIFSWQIDNVNRAPVVSGLNDIEMQEGESVVVIPKATDPDGQLVSISIDQGPDFVSLTGNKLHVDPSFKDGGSYDIVLVATDDDMSPFSSKFNLHITVAEGSGELRTISEGSESDMSDYAVHTNEQGDIVVVWADSTASVAYYYRYYAAAIGTWSAIKSLPKGINNLFVQGAGTQFLFVWTQSTNLYAQVFKDGGLVSGTLETLATSIVAGSASILNTSNSYLVRWQKQVNAGSVVGTYARVLVLDSTGGAGTWSAEASVGEVVAGATTYATAWLEESGIPMFFKGKIFSLAAGVWQAQGSIEISSPGSGALSLVASGDRYGVVWMDQLMTYVNAASYTPAAGWQGGGAIASGSYLQKNNPFVVASEFGFSTFWGDEANNTLYGSVFVDGAWQTKKAMQSSPPENFGVVPNGGVYAGKNTYLVLSTYSGLERYARFFKNTDSIWAWTDNKHYMDLPSVYAPRLSVHSIGDEYFITDILAGNVKISRLVDGSLEVKELDAGGASKPSAVTTMVNGNDFAAVWRQVDSDGFYRIVANTFYRDRWLESPLMLGGADAATKEIRWVKSNDQFCIFWLVERQDVATLKHIRSVCGF